MNLLGIVAALFGLIAFALTYARLRSRTMGIRTTCLFVLALLAIPSALFAVYYLHVLPERAWFYTLRSWTGTEFLAVFLGGAAGAFATLWPRWLLGVPLFCLLALGLIPYLKPIIGPIPDNVFQDKWQGDVCLQSTPSTCGPASLCTVLKHHGVQTSERVIAREAFSYSGGTEAWYLARYVRRLGLTPRFDFQTTFSPAVGLPAVVGVRLGGLGHFIAVLGLHDGQIAYADPLDGEHRLSLSDFQQRYSFTGFHLVVEKP
jgi:hypothetical protein